MPSLRDIKRRIKSVQNTQQITKAMEMVSAVKLRKAQQRVEAARPYGLKMQQMLESVAAAAAGLNHPLFEEREVKTTLLVVFSSDRGLAGSYNSNIIRNAVRYLHKAPPGSVRMGLIGKKAMEYFKRRSYPIDFAITDLGGNVDLVRTRRLATDITNKFYNSEVDEVRLLYTRFVSITSYRITLERFLPIEKPAGAGDQAVSDYIFEPNADGIFSNLVPRYCVTKILQAMLESFASEHGSRMISMSNATKNAKEIIENLTIVRNKARQSSITKELLDIVGGSEALK
ncbi:MAG TPA: ATP synthase F1 subunit gamma [candidate division Zixibacteria bacterium]|nr:ATP synthase F1 subunit gamma [candidate division Zixibacteria bacterium]